MNLQEKQHKNYGTPFVLRLAPETIQKIRARASANYRTMAAEVRMILDAALKEDA